MNEKIFNTLSVIIIPFITLITIYLYYIYGVDLFSLGMIFIFTFLLNVFKQIPSVNKNNFLSQLHIALIFTSSFSSIYIVYMMNKENLVIGLNIGGIIFLVIALFLLTLSITLIQYPSLVIIEKLRYPSAMLLKVDNENSYRYFIIGIIVGFISFLIDFYLKIHSVSYYITTILLLIYSSIDFILSGIVLFIPYLFLEKFFPEISFSEKVSYNFFSGVFLGYLFIALLYMLFFRKKYGEILRHVEKKFLRWEISISLLAGLLIYILSFFMLTGDLRTLFYSLLSLFFITIASLIACRIAGEISIFIFLRSPILYISNIVFLVAIFLNTIIGLFQPIIIFSSQSFKILTIYVIFIFITFLPAFIMESVKILEREEEKHTLLTYTLTIVVTIFVSILSSILLTTQGFHPHIKEKMAFDQILEILKTVPKVSLGKLLSSKIFLISFFSIIFMQTLKIFYYKFPINITSLLAIFIVGRDLWIIYIFTFIIKYILLKTLKSEIEIKGNLKSFLYALIILRIIEAFLIK